MSPLNNSSGGPLLCYVTDRHNLAACESQDAKEALLLKIGAAAAAGVDWIQIREKDLSGKDCGSLTREILRRAAKSSANKTAAARILVNDRLDIALSERAGGVHLRENSLPLPEAERLANSQAQSQDFLIGVSCHSLEAARLKAAFGVPQGLERLAEVCRAVSIPVLGIGGITLANASDCLASGASGIAAIRLFQDTRDMSSLVQSLRKLTR